MPIFRNCLRDPIPEIFDAARYLDAAVSAHLKGEDEIAEKLIRLADMPAIREWTESIWGAKSPHKKFRVVSDAPPSMPKEERIPLRMPTTAEKRTLLGRNGYHCRFCGIPLIRDTIRQRIKTEYPNALPWAPGNANQHAAFQSDVGAGATISSRMRGAAITASIT